MKKYIFLLLALLPSMAWAQSNDTILINQAQFVTEPGAFNGYDVSRLHPDHVAFGTGANFQYGYMIADDFTLTEAAKITELEVYGYQSYSTTTSTFTGLYIVIYDDNPMENGQVIWGDLTTNRMTATAWTECYRCGHSGSNPTNDERPIMSITATDLDIELEAGTYFISWGLTGTGEYGPYAIPVTIAGQSTTGNALQYDGDGLWRWVYLDQNYACPVGAAFRLNGTLKDPSVGISEAQTEHFILFPNPAKDRVNIAAKGMTRITVVNMVGQTVFDAAVNTNAYELNVEGFSAGVYAVRVAAENEVSTKQMTISR